MVENEHGKDERSGEEEGRQPLEGAPSRPEQAGSRALADALKVSFRFLKFAMVALAAIFLLTGIFTVQPEEVKLKLRFGRVIKDSSGQLVLRPGSWHLRWPWEEVVVVPTDEKTVTLENEFWAVAESGADIRTAQVLKLRTDGYLLTGDTNIVHMKLRVRYRTRSDGDGAAAYAFLVKDPEETLRRALKASVVKVVGSMPVMAVINRRGLIDAITAELNARLKKFEENSGVPLGVSLVAVEAVEQENIKNPTEPGVVRPAFFDAQNAVSFRNALVSEGQTQAQTIVNGAEARRAEILAEANGYAMRMVRSARADAAQMQQLLPVFERSKGEADLLLEDFYLRTIIEVLRESPGAFVFHSQSEGASRQLRLMFTKPLVQQTEQQPGQGQGPPR